MQYLITSSLSLPTAYQSAHAMFLIYLMHDRRSSSQPWWGSQVRGELHLLILSFLSHRPPITVFVNVDRGTKEQVYLSNGVT